MNLNISLKIKDLLNSEDYHNFKKEVCKQNIFESSTYDNKGNPLGQYGTTHSTTLFTHLALLRCIFEKKELFCKKPIFVDLGSGVGNVVIYAAHHGWKSYGIEFHKECWKASLLNIEIATESEYIKKQDASTKYGNIFPLEMEIQEFPEDKLEDDFREKLQTFSDAPKDIEIPEYKNADVFYHYQVERRQNILDLFSEYAKNGAILIFVSTRDDSFAIPNNVIELDNQLDMYIYQKVK
ncbi:MAG: hypothetical protein ACMXX5_02205 [Candidatus Woesearchaeota archaeon]